MHPPIKYYRNKDVLLITTCTEEGLPFICTSYIKAILMGHLARAQFLLHVRICHFIIMGNHIHILLIVDNPDHIPFFMSRIKTEFAHAINNLLGIRKRTVWCDGYDSPIILEKERVVEDIAYLYANPAEAGLVSSINEYPGLSSWQMYQSNERTVKAKWIQRPSVKKLAHHNLSIQEQDKIRDGLLKKSKHEFEFRLYPDAWLESFGISNEAEEWNAKILKRIKEKQQAALERRLKESKSVRGAASLSRASIPQGQTYRPQKFGKKMYVRSSNIPLRKQILSSIKQLRLRAREVLLLWRAGNRSVPYPLGLFPPCFPKISNVIRDA